MPDWEYWRSTDGTSLYNAVVLSLDLEPPSRDIGLVCGGSIALLFNPKDQKRIDSRFLVAASAIDKGELRGNKSPPLFGEVYEVKFPDFAAWAEKQEWKLPDKFPREPASLAPDWEVYRQIFSVPLEDAVALSCGIDPQKANVGIHIASLEHEERNKRVRGATSYLGNELPMQPDHGVKLSDFAVLAKKLDWDLPAEFPQEPSISQKATGWPWGTYETKLLQNLAAAAEQFWKNFDPKDTKPAPTNNAVSHWLVKEKGMTKNIADAMATIMRADNLPSGPRKTRQK